MPRSTWRTSSRYSKDDICTEDRRRELWLFLCLCGMLLGGFYVIFFFSKQAKPLISDFTLAHSEPYHQSGWLGVGHTLQLYWQSDTVKQLSQPLNIVSQSHIVIFSSFSVSQRSHNTFSRGVSNTFQQIWAPGNMKLKNIFGGPFYENQRTFFYFQVK